MADMERRVLKRQTAVEVCNTGNGGKRSTSDEQQDNQTSNSDG